MLDLIWQIAMTLVMASVLGFVAFLFVLAVNDFFGWDDPRA